MSNEPQRGACEASERDTVSLCNQGQGRVRSVPCGVRLSSATRSAIFIELVTCERLTTQG